MKDGSLNSEIKLNLGGGITHIPGYRNIDIKNGQLAYPLEFADNSVAEVRASHILEHFSFKETLNILKEWVRVLVPGGWLKVAVPDFEWVAEAYLEKRQVPLQAYVVGSQTDPNDFHKAVFDKPSLRQLLTDAGLINIQEWQSEIKDAASLPVSLNLMGQKPQPVKQPSAYSISDKSPVDPRFSEFCRSIKVFNQYSQFGEDAAIEAIFERIGTANKWCFEAGAADGLFFSNTRRLIEQGWNAVLVEPDDRMWAELVKRYPSDVKGVACLKTAMGLENLGVTTTIDRALTIAGAPLDIDLLCLDIDGQEYHVINSMVDYQPRVLVVEYDPDADPMFIPAPNGEGQAGYLAMVYVMQARGYEIVCRTKCNLIAVRDDLVNPLISGVRVEERRFVEGAWRDESAVVKETVKAVCAIAMSSPRIGYLDAADVLTEIGIAIGAPRARGMGCWWEQGLTRSINQCLKHTDRSGEPVEFIFTADYDTFATPDDAKEMIRLAIENPQYDCIVPIQARRGPFAEILAAGSSPVDWSQGLFPINKGHFGLTLFRRRVFERMRKPWFLNHADKDGEWEDGRMDADIHFWHTFNDCGLRAALATRVIIGHGDEVVSYPKIENGKITKVHVSTQDWLKDRTVPEGLINYACN